MAANSLKDIQSQIQKLQKQAEEMKSKEKQGALQQVRDLVDQYDLSAEELGFGRQKAARGKKAGGAPKKVAFRKGEQTWSGGRGAKPQWVKEILENDGVAGLEKYRV
jgi:DNA-binding protein H-NS